MSSIALFKIYFCVPHIESTEYGIFNKLLPSTRFFSPQLIILLPASLSPN